MNKFLPKTLQMRNTKTRLSLKYTPFPKKVKTLFTTHIQSQWYSHVSDMKNTALIFDIGKRLAQRL